NHPYYKIPRVKFDSSSEKQLSWKQYGLPSWEKIQMDPLPVLPSKTQAEFLEWWAKQPKYYKDDLLITNPLGFNILVTSHESHKGNPNSFFKYHVRNNNKHRYRFASEVSTII